MRRNTPRKIIIDKIKCPICGESVKLYEDGSASLRCLSPKSHCFDLSAEGYVNLMPPKGSGGGDSKAAVNARRDFLSLELYRPISDALVKILNKYVPKGGFVIDAGSGEGYYSNLIADNGFDVLGIDISKFAAQAAAKRGNQTDSANRFFCVGSVFGLPVFDSSADAVVNIFAPCCENEFVRVLDEKGIIIVVYAGPEHLMGLKRVLYEKVRENDERRDLPNEGRLVCSERVNFDITVEGTQNVQNLFAMTPYYWKTSVSDGEKLKKVEKLATKIDVIISVYKK